MLSMQYIIQAGIKGYNILATNEQVYGLRPY